MHSRNDHQLHEEANMFSKHRSRQLILSNIFIAVLSLFFGALLHSMFYPSAPPPSPVLLSSPTNNVPVAATTTSSTYTDVLVDVPFKPIPSAEALLEEQKFQTTLRSCLGDFCFDDAVSNNNGVSHVRIGILAPELCGAPTFLKMLEKFNGKNKKVQLELVHTSNVPPYGYGKNHGWSRIIRLVRKVVPHAFNLLSKKSGALDENELVDHQVRQLMRWHCRLSHVAAHTSMLTIAIEDYLSNPNFEFEKMLSFVGFKESRTDIADTVDSYKDELLSQFGSDADLSVVPPAFYASAALSIRDEMTKTNDLAKWPCTSFQQLSNRLPMASTQLAANCSAPFTKCSVGFDLKGG